MMLREIAENAAMDVQETHAEGNVETIERHDLTRSQATDRILRAFVEMLRAEAAHEEDVFAENAYNALADRIEKEIA